MAGAPDFRVLGVDVGLSGAAAIFCPRSIVKVPPRGIIRLPTVIEEMTTKKKQMHAIDCATFLGWIQYQQPTHAFVEQVWAMPPKFDEETGEQRGAGNTSSFNFGRSYGSVLAVVECFGLKPVKVPPQRWQKIFGLTKLPKGSDKGEASRQLVLQRHPSAEPFLKFKKDHNSAEALLIAEYGAIITDRLEIADEIED